MSNVMSRISGIASGVKTGVVSNETFNATVEGLNSKIDALQSVVESLDTAKNSGSATSAEGFEVFKGDFKDRLLEVKSVDLTDAQYNTLYNTLKLRSNKDVLLQKELKDKHKKILDAIMKLNPHGLYAENEASVLHGDDKVEEKENQKGSILLGAALEKDGTFYKTVFLEPSGTLSNGWQTATLIGDGTDPLALMSFKQKKGDDPNSIGLRFKLNYGGLLFGGKSKHRNIKKRRTRKQRKGKK